MGRSHHNIGCFKHGGYSYHNVCVVLNIAAILVIFFISILSATAQRATVPIPDVEVRLADGSVTEQEVSGRLEVRIDGVWGSVCQNGFTQNEARIVCSHLGFVGGVAYYNGYYETTQGPIWLSHVTCPFDASRLDRCVSLGVRVTPGCNHDTDVSVFCTRQRQTDGNAGCDNGGATPAPTVAPPVTSQVPPTPVTSQTAPTQVTSQPLATQVTSQSPPTPVTSQTPSTQVTSQTPPTVTPAPLTTPTGGGSVTSSAVFGEEGVVALVGGVSAASGRVQVYHEGQWGTVCSEMWDNKDARVVCRQLGWKYGFATLGGAYGAGTGPIWLRDVKCTSEERRLVECSHADWGRSGCTHIQDAGVDCFNELPVRLAGSPSPTLGRLEVYTGGQWGTVCQNNFEDADARVVCRGLGLSGGLTLRCCSTHPPGTGPVWLGDVDCWGHETSLIYCSNSGLGRSGCTHSDDVGVLCEATGAFTTLPPPVFGGTGTIQIVGGQRTGSGRVEVYHEGRWGTVCDDWWDQKDARVACRQLGWSYGFARHLGVAEGAAGGPIWLNGVRCEGDEETLLQCGHDDWGVNDCDHSQDAGVDCFNELPIRLVGGSSARRGRVEVLFDGVWGTVCEDSFGNNDARVVCGELGYAAGVAEYCCGSHPPGTGTVWLTQVDCWGHERSLIYCRNGGFGNTAGCSHSRDVGVWCDPP